MLAAVDALIAADDRVEVFEYCLSRLLRDAPSLAVLAEADSAYLTGLRRAGLGPMPFARPGVVGLDAVWPVLDGRDKETVVASMVSVLGHDGVLAVPECAMLHCPLPPLGPDTRK